jgi:hypothetical protein
MRGGGWWRFERCGFQRGGAESAEISAEKRSEFCPEISEIVIGYGDYYFD